MPSSVLDASNLWDVAVPYWRAFWALARSRPVAAGMGGVAYLPIPYSEMSHYARDHELAFNDAELDDFIDLMQQMDAVHLEYLAAQMAADLKKKS